MLYRLFILLLVSLFATSATHAQDFNAYQKKWLVQGPDTLPYRLLLPEGFDASKKYPLVLFLHGSGERGRDNEAQLTHGGQLFLNDTARKAFPAIVVFPQCPTESRWSNVQITTDSSTGQRTFAFQEGGAPTRPMAMLENLLKELQHRYRIKRDQVYVMGLSMGGMGTFELARRRPELFAAAIPICGGANTATAAQLKRIHWWVFHGGKDDVVPPRFSEEMVTA